jgi:hypothetical protein
VGLRAGLNRVAKIKNNISPPPRGELNPGRPARSLVSILTKLSRILQTVLVYYKAYFIRSSDERYIISIKLNPLIYIYIYITVLSIRKVFQYDVDLMIQKENRNLMYTKLYMSISSVSNDFFYILCSVVSLHILSTVSNRSVSAIRAYQEQ